MKKIIVLVCFAALAGCHQLHTYPSLYLDMDTRDSGIYVYKKTIPAEKFRAAIPQTFKTRYFACCMVGGGKKLVILNDSEVLFPVYDEGMIKDMVFRKTQENTWKENRIMTY